MDSSAKTPHVSSARCDDDKRKKLYSQSVHNLEVLRLRHYQRELFAATHNDLMEQKISLLGGCSAALNVSFDTLVTFKTITSSSSCAAAKKLQNKLTRASEHH